MNQIIRQIAEQGYGQVLYNIFFAAGFVAVFLFALIAGKKYSIGICDMRIYHFHTVDVCAVLDRKRI